MLAPAPGAKAPAATGEDPAGVPRLGRGLGEGHPPSEKGRLSPSLILSGGSSKTKRFVSFNKNTGERSAVNFFALSLFVLYDFQHFWQKHFL